MNHGKSKVATTYFFFNLQMGNILELHFLLLDNSNEINVC